MWQLLGFGRYGTPERRYALFDDFGAVQWAGADVRDAVLYIAANGLDDNMEKDGNGGAFVRERYPTRGTYIGNLPTGH